MLLWCDALKQSAKRSSFQLRVFEENYAMGIKLHYHPLSTYSRRVLIAFAEKQIPHELVVIDMAARRHREQPYLSLNPCIGRH